MNEAAFGEFKTRMQGGHRFADADTLPDKQFLTGYRALCLGAHYRGSDFVHWHTTVSVQAARLHVQRY